MMTTSSSSAGGGDGILSGDWAKMAARVSGLGVADAAGCVRVARANGASPSDVDAICEFYESCKVRPNLNVLHWRIKACLPGQDGSVGWPENGQEDEASSRERIDAKRRADIDASRAMLIVQKGRRAGRADDEIREALESEGLEWP